MRNNFKRRIKKWKEEFEKFGPLKKAYLIFLLPSFFITAFCLYTGNYNKSLRDGIAELVSTLDAKELFIDLVIKTPLLEEAIFRGPAYLVLILGIFLQRFDQFSWLKTKTVRNFTVLCLLVWIAILVPNVIFASYHAVPAVAFLFGTVSGWLLWKTKNILYSFGFHMIISLICFFGFLLNPPPLT